MSRWLLITTVLFFPFHSHLLAETNDTVIASSTETDLKKIPFGRFILRSSNLWDLSKQEIVNLFVTMDAKCLWITVDKSVSISTADRIRIGNHKSYETIMRFKDDRLSELRMSLYNRDDAGEMSENDFKKKMDSVIQTIDEISHVQGQDISKLNVSLDPDLKTIVWVAEPTAIRLDYATNDEKGEFANLTLSKGNKSVTPESLGGAHAVSIDPQVLQAHVKTNAAGDFWVEIPMLSSVNEAYCGPVTLERIFRYYGLDISEYEVAKMVHKKTGQGVDPSFLFKQIQSIRAPLGIHAVSLKQWDMDETIKIFDEYNELAKKVKKPSLRMPDEDFNIDIVYAQMDLETFLASRRKHEAEIKQLMATVSERIRMGAPICWGVMLGLVNEEPKGPHIVHGHLRIIIGFNEKTSEILYTDSWGYRHELKRMSLANAYAITLHMFSFDLTDPSREESMKPGDSPARK